MSRSPGCRELWRERRLVVWSRFVTSFPPPMFVLPAPRCRRKGWDRVTDRDPRHIIIFGPSCNSSRSAPHTFKPVNYPADLGVFLEDISL
jgi:hypothetical protein